MKKFTSITIKENFQGMNQSKYLDHEKFNFKKNKSLMGHLLNA